jgi:hypothetical protein
MYRTRCYTGPPFIQSTWKVKSPRPTAGFKSATLYKIVHVVEGDIAEVDNGFSRRENFQYYPHLHELFVLLFFLYTCTSIYLKA